MIIQGNKIVSYETKITNKKNLKFYGYQSYNKYNSIWYLEKNTIKVLKDNVNYFTFIRDLSRNKLRNVSAQAFATNKKLTAL